MTTRRGTVAAAAVLCALTWGAVSPAAAANKDMERLQIQVATLQSQLAELQRQAAESTKELKRLSELAGEQNASLKKALQDQRLQGEATQIALKELGDAVADIRAHLPGATAPAATPAASPGASGGTAPPASSTAVAPAAGAPLPGELYSQSYADFTRGQYDLAIAGFREYLRLYPDNERADDAQYQIGVCLAGKQKYAEAIEAWDTLFERYPSSDKLPDAHVKKGGAFERLGRKREALTQYRYVVEHYPNAPAAKIAREKLSPQ
jgi:tol-pal system protein YbgF